VQERHAGAVMLTGTCPNMDGYEFLRQYGAASPGGDEAPRWVFCTTEIRHRIHISRALAAGATEYIMKAIDKEIHLREGRRSGPGRGAVGNTSESSAARRGPSVTRSI